MTCIVVLGMHGAGTSLVAGMLHAAGVEMNPNPKGVMRYKKYMTYEDAAFVRLNVAILHSAGGGWKFPPAQKRLETIPDNLAERMLDLIDAREREYKLWGFKDPRTALTVHLYHPHLYEPRYVFVERDHEDIARSLVTRGHKTGGVERWLPLIKTYYDRIHYFLALHTPTVMHASFEALIKGEGEARLLMSFVGLDDVEEATRQALKVVKR